MAAGAAVGADGLAVSALDDVEAFASMFGAGAGADVDAKTANGRIRSLGGYGEIEVVNNTDYNLVVKDLDASRRGAGVVLIKDKAKFEQTPPTPDFTAGAAGSSADSRCAVARR